MPCSTRSLTCSAATAAATRCVVCGSWSKPSKRRANQAGTLAPQRAAKPETCLKLCTGAMPGTIGAQMRARCAGVYLGFGAGEVPRQVATVGMTLRVAGDRNLEIADPLQAADQVCGIGVAAGMGSIAAAGAAHRVTAQGDDVVDAARLIAARDLVDLCLGRLHAGKMCRRHEAGFAGQARHGGVRAFAGGAARAVGYRDEAGPQGLETANGRPERLLHLFRLGREEL